MMEYGGHGLFMMVLWFMTVMILNGFRFLNFYFRFQLLVLIMSMIVLSHYPIGVSYGARLAQMPQFKPWLNRYHCWRQATNLAIDYVGASDRSRERLNYDWNHQIFRRKPQSTNG